MARGMSFDLRPLGFSPTLARPSSSPGDCCCRLLECGPLLLGTRTKSFLLQAVGASSVSSLRTMTPHDGGGELDIGGSARCGGAHDRTRVRTRVNARAWQGLRRRFKAPSPSSRRTYTRGGIGTGQLEKYAELAKCDFFFAALGQTAACGRLVGRHRVQKRS